MLLEQIAPVQKALTYVDWVRSVTERDLYCLHHFRLCCNSLCNQAWCAREGVDRARLDAADVSMFLLTNTMTKAQEAVMSMMWLVRAVRDS